MEHRANSQKTVIALKICEFWIPNSLFPFSNTAFPLEKFSIRPLYSIFTSTNFSKGS